MIPAYVRCLVTFSLLLPAALATPHEGVPMDPGVPAAVPREQSRLYLERKDMPWTKLEDGIEYQEIRQGTGAQPYQNAMVYIMWRMFDKKDGREVHYRTKHRTDHFFYDGESSDTMGGGGMLHAVELLLRDMREGGKRLLSVSAAKAFGREGWSDSHFVVPPDTDIIVELSLLWVRDPNPKRYTAGDPHPRPYAALAAGKEPQSPHTTSTQASIVPIP